MSSEPRKAAVLGKPVAHSLSPVLHGAAFAALGLTGWTYERIEASAEELPGLVRAAGPEWAGFSVTMPGKRAALDHADEVTSRAAAVGAANTLVRTATGWLADCTDVDGVTGALRAARVQVALELLEDLRVGLADDVGQHVQPAAVGHADDDLVQAGLRRAVEDRVQQRDDGLAALEGEALLADVLGLQEGLEGLRSVQPAQDAQLLLALRLGVAALHAVLDPLALLGVLDVH